MSDTCNAKHPEIDLAVCLLSGEHDQHMAINGLDRVWWPNEDYVAPPVIRNKLGEIIKTPKDLEELAHAIPIEPKRPPWPGFDGATYVAHRDYDRLSSQYQRVWRAIADCQWHTLAELHDRTGDPEASISARLRDFRKVKFGGHKIEHRNLGHGTWYYRLVAP